MMVRMTLKNLKAIPSIVLLWKRECGKFYAAKYKTEAKFKSVKKRKWLFEVMMKIMVKMKLVILVNGNDFNIISTNENNKVNFSVHGVSIKSTFKNSDVK